MNRKRITKKATLALVAMMTVTSVVGCTQSNNSNKNQQGSNQKTEQKTEQKTAKLFETAICGSLILAKTNKNASEFAKNFGIAFQIRDDIINIKTSKTDIKDGIYTAPIIYAGNTENYTNGIEKSQILLNNYIENAYQAIKHIEENKYKIAIIELLGLLKNE